MEQLRGRVGQVGDAPGQEVGTALVEVEQVRQRAAALRREGGVVRPVVVALGDDAADRDLLVCIPQYRIKVVPLRGILPYYL